MTEARSGMSSGQYGEDYWERGVGSNYVNYADDPGWPAVAEALDEAMDLVLGRRWAFRRWVFEVAAAKGWFLYHAAHRGMLVRGMDISEWAVTHAAPGMGRYLRLGDAAADPIRAAPTSQDFDAVVSWEFLEHVPVDELGAVLGNMVAAVRPGGLLVHRVGLAGHDSHHDDDVTHQPAQTRQWWLDRIGAGGLTRRPDVEALFDAATPGRDWVGRYFAYVVG